MSIRVPVKKNLIGQLVPGLRVFYNEEDIGRIEHIEVQYLRLNCLLSPKKVHLVRRGFNILCIEDRGVVLSDSKIK